MSLSRGKLPNNTSAHDRTPSASRASGRTKPRDNRSINKIDAKHDDDLVRCMMGWVAIVPDTAAGRFIATNVSLLTASAACPTVPHAVQERTRGPRRDYTLHLQLTDSPTGDG